jgi:hypothetical protein
MGVSFEELSASIASEMFWSSIGYWVLAVGLAGDILVLVIPKHRERLEKILSGFFIIVIIVGVTIEHNADTRIAVLVSQQEEAGRLEIARLKAPRSLTSRQSDELIGKLRSYEAKTFWLLTERTDDDDRSEQMLLSRQLLNAFSQAGWTKTSHVMTAGQKEPQEFSPVSDRGISVQFASDPKSRELGDRMAKDLRAAGLDCEKNEDPTQLPNTIVIEVGLR